MSYWSHNPELYDEIITNALPEPWQTQVIEGEIELTDVPDDVFLKAEVNGTADYWGSKIDEAMMQHEDDVLRKENLE